MSPDRCAAWRPNVLLNRLADRNTAYIPQWRGRETFGLVDCAVNLRLGVFVALPAVAIVLIRDGGVSAAATTVLALTAAANRSHLAIRFKRAS